MRIRIWVLAGIAIVLSGCDIDEIGSFGNSHSYEKDFHYSYALKRGGRLTLENFNGSVEITGWDRDTVEIDGSQYGASAELRDAIKIDVVATGDSVQIRTIRPVDRRGSLGAKYAIKAPRKIELDRIVTSNGSMKVNDIEGTMRLRTSNGSVRTARVRGALDVTTSNAAVDVEDLDGPATIRTSNGRVTAERIRGVLQASTSNGAIQARLVQPEPHKPVKLQTSNGGIDLAMESLTDNEVRASTNNGGITVRLPSTASARVRAHTSNSSVQTNFDVKREDAGKKNHLDGVIGGGGPTVDLTSSNGSIRLLKL